MKRMVSKSLQGVIALGIALGSASCTDLTEVPFTEITDANFDPTEADLAALIGQAYAPVLRQMWMGWHGGVDYFEEASDHLLTPVRPNGWEDGGIYIMTHQHRWGASGQQNNMWNRAYAGITNANRVIWQIENDIIPLDEPTLTDTLMELQALRAYYYWLLLDNYGRAPISTDFGSTELPSHADTQELFDFVVSQFTEALPHLSVAAGQSSYGRMNRWAALGILARVSLNAEVYLGTPRYDEVIALTQEIMDSGLYQLESSYRRPFARDNDTSAELIWAVPYDAARATQSNFHMKTLKPDLQYVFGMVGAPWGGSASNPQFIDTYDPDDTRLQDTWLTGPHFDEQGRGYNFVQHVPAITDRVPGVPRIEFHHGYPVWKYEIYAGMTGASDVDYPILRYAEVLMMQAEARLRTGDADGAAALVTQVRERAFADTDPSKAVVTGPELLQGSVYNYGWYDVDGVVKDGPGGTPTLDGGADIQYGRFLDELGWEFAIEGHRRTHLVRFDVFTTKSWFNHTPNGHHRNVFAIPNDAMNTNPNLTQNPGY